VIRIVLGIAASCMAFGGPPSAQAPRRVAVDSLLQHLVGTWRMQGAVGGRPATYSLDAARVLGNTFVELHMVDASRPPTYEARVFIGADTTSGMVIAHWLDMFGAAYSIPHATGSVRGDTLLFTFAYSTGPFRDTFIYDRNADTWHFRLEQASATGGPWRPFAEYEVRRR
jgi:hypothetical protein